MKRIEKFNKDKMAEVLSEAKIAFDPESDVESLKKLAVNNIGKFVPALDKLHPLPTEEEKAPKKKAKAEDVSTQIEAILAKAQATADKIIADAREFAAQANVDAKLKPAKKVYTQEQLSEKVRVIAKKRWECEMNGHKIKCEEGDVFEVEFWMQMKLAKQGVV